MNSWLHHHNVVATVVAHGLAVTNVKEDVEHMSCLASHQDPRLPHYVPISNPHQLKHTHQWGECSIMNLNPQGLEMAWRITACCHGPMFYNRNNP